VRALTKPPPDGSTAPSAANLACWTATLLRVFAPPEPQ
jgi:hypothetical protein